MPQGATKRCQNLFGHKGLTSSGWLRSGMPNLGCLREGCFSHTSPIFSPLNLLQGAQTLSVLCYPDDCSGLGTNPLRFFRERCPNWYENRTREVVLLHPCLFYPDKHIS